MKIPRWSQIALLAAAGSTGAVGAEISQAGFSVPPPPGWTQADNAGAVLLTPPATPSTSFFALVLAQDAGAADTTAHVTDLSWAAFEQIDGSTEIARNADVPIDGQDGVTWVWRSGSRKARNGASVPAGIAVSYRPPTAHVIYVFAASAAQWTAHRDAIWQMLRGTRVTLVAGAGSAPSGAAAATGPGEKFGQGRSGAYFGSGNGYRASASGGTTIARSARVLAVLPDGRWRSELPPRGLDTDLAADARESSGLWGQWEERSGIVHASRTNESLVLDPAAWSRLASVDGLRLDGVFVREDTRGTWGSGSEPQLVLRGDGTFDDRTGLLRMVGSLANFEGIPARLSADQEAQLFAPGGGRYAFRNFTLICTYSDGRVRKLNVYIAPNDDAAHPRRLVIGSYALVRK